MTTTKITITMSDRAPVSIDPEEWPTIASTEAHDGQVRVQANTEWSITVREHKDGRRIVSGLSERGSGGKPAGWRGARAGYLVAPVDSLRQPPSDPDGPLRAQPDADGTVRAIRRVGGVIGRADLADDCIAELPAEEI